MNLIEVAGQVEELSTLKYDVTMANLRYNGAGTSVWLGSVIGG